LLQLHLESHVGPLPPASELAAYEAVQPGLAERIVAMAEKAANTRHEATLAPIRAEAFAIKAATVAVAGLPLVLAVGAIFLAAHGADGAALYSALGAGLTGGPQIIQALRRPKVVQQVVQNTSGDPRQKTGPTPKQTKPKKKK
jgi:uncharacterized membrane protein